MAAPSVVNFTASIFIVPATNGCSVRVLSAIPSRYTSGIATLAEPSKLSRAKENVLSVPLSESRSTTPVRSKPVFSA